MFCLKNFKAKVIHIASFRHEIPTGDSEIQGRCSVCSSGSGGIFTALSLGKSKAKRTECWSGLTVGPCHSGRRVSVGPAGHWADMTTLSQAPHPESLDTWLPTPWTCLVGLSSSLPPSCCLCLFVHWILFLSLLCGQLRCRTRCHLT